MAGSSSNMKINIVAVDKASSTLSKVGGSFKGLASSAAGVATGIAVEKIGEKIASFGAEAITKFQDTGTEVVKMQRLIGGSVEDTSRLSNSFAALGIDSDKSTRFLVKFSGGLAKNTETLKGMGVATKDAHGHTRSFSAMLPEIADSFKNMPNGIDKTALATKLFGKGSSDMLKLLNKGSDGLKAMGEESDKLGTTMGTKDIDAINKNIAAKRQFNEAMKGVSITVGRVLYPVLTLALDLMNKYLAPAIKWVADKFVILGDKVKTFFGGAAAGQIKSMGDKFNTFKDAVANVWAVFKTLVLPKAFTALKDIFKDVSNFVTTVFVPIFAALSTAIQSQLMPTFQALGDYFNQALKPVFMDLWGIIQNNLLPLYQTLSGFIAGTLIPAFSAIWTVVIKDVLPVFTGLVNVVRTMVMPILKTIIDTIRTSLVPVFKTIVDVVIKNVLPAVKNLFDNFKTNALPVLMHVAGIIGVVVSWLVKVAGVIIKTVLPPLLRFIGPILGFLIKVLGFVIKWVFKLIGWILDLGKHFKSIAGRVKDFAVSAAGHFNDFKNKVVDRFNEIKTTIKNAFDTVWGFITGLKDKIVGIGSSLWDGLKTGLTTVIGFLRDSLNGLIGLFNKPIQFINDHNGPLPDIPLIPNIPALAMGGIVTKPTYALIGEAGPEAVVPLGRGGGLGGTHIHISPKVMPGTEDVMARAIVKALNDYQRRGGRLQFTGA